MSAVLSASSNREAWLAERVKYYGGTDVAAIVGMHKYRTPLDVYLEKTGNAPEVETSKLATVGLALEPLIKEWTEAEFGWKIEPAPTVYHADLPFIAVNPDGFIWEDSTWECKTYAFTTASEWGDVATDQVPDAYRIQSIWQCGVTGRKRTLITACDRATCALSPYMVEADPEFFEVLLEATKRFHHDHVLAGKPPAATVEDADKISYLYPSDDGEILLADQSIDELAGELESLTSQKREVEKKVDDLRARISLAIGGNLGIETVLGTFLLNTVSGRVNWKNVAFALGAKVGDRIVEDHRAPSSRSLKTPFKAEKSNV